MRNDDDWALDAVYYDFSVIRNKLASDLWNTFNDNQDLNTDINGNFVEVFINNEYWGLYNLKELVDRKTTQIKEDGLLLQLSGRPTDEIIQKMLDGNYVVENDYIFWYGIKNDALDSTISNFARIYSDYYLSDDKDQSILENFDVNSYINSRLLILLIDGWDNINGNMFLSQQTIDSKIVTTPWDMDNSFGYFKANDIWTNRSPPDNDTLFLKLIENTPKINSMMSERWFELRNSTLKFESIEKLIDSYLNVIVPNGALVRNYERWEVQSGEPSDIEKFKRRYDDEINFIKEWMADRLEYMDEYFRGEV